MITSRKNVIAEESQLYKAGMRITYKKFTDRTIM